MAKKKFIPRPKESERVIRKRWTKKRDSIENLSNNVQKLRYNVSLGLKNESKNEKNFLTCLVIAIMDKSFERVGNEASAANGKVGITGLNKDQVTIIGNKIILEYTGKSGVEHEKMFSDAKIAKALKIAKKNSPDENVFTTSKGFKIRNNRINRYLSDFWILSKNLRGYGANNLLVKKLSELEPEETEAKRKVQFNKVARFVAKKVGHGLPTLKKHYMIPEIEPNFIEFSKVIEIDDVSKFNDGGTIKAEEKTKKTKPSENPNVDKFTCEDAIPDSKLKKSLPKEIEDILKEEDSFFKDGGEVIKPKIIVHNNTDSASDKDAQKIIINYLKNINESGHKKFFEFLKKSNQNINDYEAVFYLSKDYYDKNVGKYYSNKIIYQKNVSDAYQNALNYDDAYPNFIRIYKHGNIKGFAATTEFDLFGDWEGDKYDDNGRLKQELKEQAIQQLKKDLYVTNNQNSGEYKMKEGGDIKNLGNDILPIGSIIYVKEFRSYHKYEVVGFVEKREGSGIRYDVYELKADMSGVKGKKTQITFPYPNTKTKFRYNATIPKEGSKLISQSEIDSEKRRGSESEVVIKWEGNKPSYLMTKEEYKSIVTPKMKEFNKFISKNKEYFSKKDYYGIDYLDFESFKSIHEPSQYSTVERDFLQRSKTSEGTVPKQADEKLIKELNEYKDYFANIFGRENIKKIEDDEVGNNKRSIRRAIDSGVYEKLLREGKINYTFLKTVFDSVGINIPTKLEKIESEVVDKGITSDVQISLKEKTENFFSNLKRLFEKEIRFYADTFKEHYIESIKRMKNFCDRHKEFVNYDTFAYNYSINNNYQPTPIYENVRGIQKLKGYNYHPDIQKLFFLNKIFENSGSNESVRFFIADNWEELLEVRALDYANDLFKNFGRRILQETEVINSIDKNFPEIQNARVLRLTEKGFEANFDLKYPNGFVLSVETQVIYAGGYNIQALHLRGLFKFQYKGKFISEKELIEAYKSFSGEEKTIEKGSLIINEISIPENIDVLLKEKYTLNNHSDFYSSELRKLAGESGLVSEEVRKSDEYIRLNVKSKISFKKLQEFNESEKNKTIDDFVRKLDRVTQQKIRNNYSGNIEMQKGGDMLLAPNGKKSNLTPEQYNLVRTPEFISWFGDWINEPENASKVVDENGEPLVCYHKTNNKFTIFDKEKLGSSSGWDTAYFGFYFSNKYEKTAYGKIAVKCFLNIKNPYYIISETYSDFDYDYKKFDVNNFSENDGVIIKTNRLILGDKADKHFVAFESNQIKLSNGNNTTFDGSNPDIRFEDGGTMLLAPNGKPSKLSEVQYKLVRTPAFKKWFGDWINEPENASKVIDENGEPMVVWHGTKEIADNFIIIDREVVFKPKFNKFSTIIKNEKGIYFSPNKKIAEGYGTAIAYFLKIKNLVQYENVVPDNYAKSEGIYRMRGSAIGLENAYEIAVFNSNQIKLADGSNTTFDGSNSDVRFDKGGEFDSCIIKVKAKMSNGGELKIEKKKVYEGDKILRDMPLDEVEKYIGIYHEKDGNMFFAKNKFIIWFYDTTDFANKINSGEYDFLMFPNRMKGFSFNSVGIIDEVWRAKYQNKHKGAKNLLGMVQGWYDEVNNKIIIHFMSVRPSAKRNHINSFMVQYAKKVFESTDVVFHEPTAQGYSFIESEKFEEGGDLKENSKKHTYYIQERVKWGEKTWVIMERYPYLTGFAEEEYNGEIYTDENKAKSKLDLINLLNKDKHEEGGDLKNNFKVEVVYDLLAPNGKPSNLTPEQYKLVRSPEFISWFGDWENSPETASKVVDENGEPLVVYHGTNKKFNVFDLSKVGSSSDSGWFGEGFYFAPTQLVADYYGDETIKVFINLKKPLLVVTKAEIQKKYNTNNSSELTEKIIEDGYDGVLQVIVLKNKKTKIRIGEVVAFKPNQIKLADGSNITFDGSNPDIRYAKGGNILNMSFNHENANIWMNQYSNNYSEFTNFCQFILDNKIYENLYNSIIGNYFKTLSKYSKDNNDETAFIKANEHFLESGGVNPISFLSKYVSKYLTKNVLSVIHNIDSEISLYTMNKVKDFILNSIEYKENGLDWCLNKFGYSIVSTKIKLNDFIKLQLENNISKCEPRFKNQLDKARKLNDSNKFQKLKAIFVEVSDVELQEAIELCDKHNSKITQEFPQITLEKTGVQLNYYTLYKHSEVYDVNSKQNIIVAKYLQNVSIDLLKAVNKLISHYPTTRVNLSTDDYRIKSSTKINSQNNPTITFGKYNGKDILSIWKLDKKYCLWLKGEFEKNKNTSTTQQKIYDIISQLEIEDTNFENGGDIRFDDGGEVFNIDSEIERKKVISNIMGIVSFRKFGNAYRKHIDEFFLASMQYDGGSNDMSWKEKASYIIGDGNYSVTKEQFIKFMKEFPSYKFNNGGDIRFDDGGELEQLEIKDNDIKVGLKIIQKKWGGNSYKITKILPNNKAYTKADVRGNYGGNSTYIRTFDEIKNNYIKLIKDDSGKILGFDYKLGKFKYNEGGNINNSEIKIKVYRGIGNNVYDEENDYVIWVAEDRRVAENYSKNGNVIELEVQKPLNPFEIPFNNIYVKGSDIGDRLTSIVNERIQDDILGNVDIDEEKYKKILYAIAAFVEKSGEKSELYSHKTNNKESVGYFVKALKLLGYDGLIQKESYSSESPYTTTRSKDESITYGIFKDNYYNKFNSSRTKNTFDGSNPDIRFDRGGSIISKEIWNKWLKENTNERGIAEYESNDGTEFSFDYVNSIITISRKKYPKGLDMVIKKENYSTGELSKNFKAFDERVKELVFGNKSFKLSDNKQTLIEHENNPDISFEDGGEISKSIDDKLKKMGFQLNSQYRFGKRIDENTYITGRYDKIKNSYVIGGVKKIKTPLGENSIGINFNFNDEKEFIDKINQYLSQSNNPDIKFEDGGGVSFDKVISASTRFRPTETVVFDPPLEGKNGAKLISYTWSYEWTMTPNREGELKSKRISDWTQAEISADTGRDIVHQYTILMPDGEYKTVSSDSVPVLLGYLDKKELKSFPNLVTASKTLAKQQMQLAILEAQKKEYDELIAKFRNAEKPEVKKISNTDELPENIKKWSDLRGSENTYFSIGDIFIGQPNEHKWENQKVVYTEADKPDRYTIEQLTSQWVSKRVEENGGVNPRGLYDLKNRVARQKRKVENILNSKMENGGVIVGEEMADNKFPTLDEAYDIIENEESNQGGVWIAEEDSDYSEDAKFQDKEQAMLYVKEIYGFMESISDDDFIPVYRCVSAEEVDLDPYSIGESWSIYLDSAKEFGRHLGEPLSKLKIISGYVPKENVDWENAIRLYHLFSDSSSSESEFELPIPSNNKILNVTVSNFKDAKELPEYNKNYKNGGDIVGEEIKNKIINILKTSKKYSRYNIDEAQNKEYNLIKLAINQNNYFGRSVRKANENYLFIPLSIELNVGYGTDKRVDYMYFPKPNSNTKIKIVSPEPSEDSTDDEKEELKKYIKPILYDSSLVNENNELIDNRYINIFDYEELDSSVVDEEHLYRGMSSLELDNIISNKYIKSDASMNLQGQEETTSFAQYPSQASSYAFGFTAWYDDVTFENPKYVIKIKREGLSYKPALEKEPKNEVNVYGETPLSNIVDIYEIRLGVADSGSITLKEEFNGNIQEGSRSPIHKKAFVRKLSLKELEVIIGKKYNDGGDIDSNDFDDYRDYDELSGTIVGEVLDEQYYRYLDVFPQTQRFILSQDEEIKFRDKTQDAKDTFKPRGLWYAFGMDWFDAVQSVVPSYASRYNFIHTIKVTDKVCSIKTIEEAIEFTDKYGFGEGHFYKQYLIDWSKVEKDYSGVEALDPIRWCRTEGLEGKLWWMYSWDAASGCIWKSDGIESIEPYDYKEVYKNKMKEWEDHEEMMNREYNERKKSSNHPMKKGGSMPSHYIKIVSKDGDYVGVMKFNPNNTRRVMSLADLASSSRKAGYKLIPIDSKKYDELVYNIDYEKLEKFQKDIDKSDGLGSDVHDLSFKKGGSLKLEDKDSIYKDWKELINMSYRELKSFYDSKEGKEAGLSKDEADDLGIHSGRESAKWILKMKHTKRNDWTDNMWEWAKRQISFVKRMSASKGELYDDNGNKTRKHTSLLIWGHNPEKHKMTFGGYVGSVDTNGTEPFIDSDGRKIFKIDDFNAEIDENKVYEIIESVNKLKLPFESKLTELMYFWDGYKYYPTTQDIILRFYSNELDGNNASYNKSNGEININCFKLNKDYGRYEEDYNRKISRMDEERNNNSGAARRKLTRREYVCRLFRRKLFHEIQHVIQRREGIEPVSTASDSEVLKYIKEKYNKSELTDSEFELFICEKHGCNYRSAIYKEYVLIPTEKECFDVENDIQKEYNKLDDKP